MVNPITLRVAANFVGERLDRALVRFLPPESGASVSRSAAQRWIRDGRVLIDGLPVTDPARTLRLNSSVVVTPAEPPPSDALPEDLPLDVLHEDADVIVVNKAAGMVVHPAAGHASGTLVNALLHRFGPLPVGAVSEEEEATEDAEEAARRERYGRPGIVHRLDRYTSGVMVVARSDRARATLMEQFAAHSIERAYRAIAEGLVPLSCTYDTMHGRHPVDRKRFSGKARNGKRSVTHVKRLEVFEGACAIECRLETGRTHQIRVHLSEAGFPLLADAMYGRTPSREPLRTIATTLGRQALHAAVLGFVHPSGKLLRFETPLPEDMQVAFEALRAHRAAIK